MCNTYLWYSQSSNFRLALGLSILFPRSLEYYKRNFKMHFGINQKWLMTREQRLSPVCLLWQALPMKNVSPSIVSYYYQIQTQEQLQKPQLRTLSDLKPKLSLINDHRGWQFRSLVLLTFNLRYHLEKEICYLLNEPIKCCCFISISKTVSYSSVTTVQENFVGGSLVV